MNEIFVLNQMKIGQGMQNGRCDTGLECAWCIFLWMNIRHPLAFALCVCMCVSVHAKSLQSCSSVCNPMDCSSPGSSVHGILQARILEWIIMCSSKGSSNPGTELKSLMSPVLVGRFFTTSTTWDLRISDFHFYPLSMTHSSSVSLSCFLTSHVGRLSPS